MCDAAGVPLAALLSAANTHDSQLLEPLLDAAPAVKRPGRGHDHPHAVRILARAWLYVIWRCWQNGTGYDPTRHNALQRLLAPNNINTAAA